MPPWLGANRPLVVVDHDDEAASELSGVVEALEGESARQRAVADDRHHVVALAGELARGDEAAGDAQRGGGVPHREEVVL